MKNLLLSIAILTSAIYANELKWVDEQVQAIKPARTGMQRSELSSLKNPFIFIKKTDKNKKSTPSSKKPSVKKVVKKQIDMKLTLVINKSAQISGKWYKTGEKINGYTIQEITPRAVLLKKKNKELLLTTNSKNKTLKFKN
jgi:hypothetical protein